MSKKFPGKATYEPEMESLRNDYSVWREQNREAKTPFFIVYKDFEEEHLREISGGALKLFLFFGFHTNNFTGECWVSSPTIADFFKVDERTVKRWIEELEARGLIKRIQTGYKRVANTFLIPYRHSKQGR